MRRVIILTIVATILVRVAIFILSRDAIEAPVFSPTPTPTPMPVSTFQETHILVPAASKIIVTYSDSGYNLPSVTINKGDVIIFKNNSSKMMWTASAVHPTHKAYPRSDITKCGTAAQSSIFDACKGYGPGQSWEFKFNEAGTWKYHNHLQPSHTGTVVVD